MCSFWNCEIPYNKLFVSSFANFVGTFNIVDKFDKLYVCGIDFLVGF